MSRYQSAFVLLALLFLVGCRKDPIGQLNAEEQRIYITHKDPAVNFSNYKTFSVADYVMLIEDNNSRQQTTAADRALISAFITALEGRRFNRVERNAQPDLGVQISKIIRTSTGVVTIGDYWGFWDPGFWGPGFGPGWGWGPPVWGTATYQVQEGMLAIDIVDLKNTSGNLKVIWNGLVRGPGTFNADAVNSMVQQLMSQSPYLQTN